MPTYHTEDSAIRSFRSPFEVIRFLLPQGFHLEWFSYDRDEWFREDGAKALSQRGPDGNWIVTIKQATEA